MARKIKRVNVVVKIIYGSDHALGGFTDVIDLRYARSADDRQGEGYVFEWSSTFGITTNLIEATEDDIKQGDKKIVELCNAFCEKHGYK